jgi:hypothetical protein
MSQCVQMICVPDAKKGDDGSVAALVHSPREWDRSDYPLVTTGAGALPLPTKHPPKLKPATTKTNASATFFITFPLFMDIKESICALLQLVHERHSGWIAAAQSLPRIEGLCTVPDTNVLVGHPDAARGHQAAN